MTEAWIDCPSCTDGSARVGEEEAVDCLRCAGRGGYWSGDGPAWKDEPFDLLDQPSGPGVR